MSTEAIRLLIVDDDDAIRVSLSDYFEDQDFEVRSAESGEAALELLKEFNAQVAIVDIRMGGMSGDEFIRIADHASPGCNYIICTGSPDYGAPSDLLEHKKVLNRIFNKPVTDLGALKQAVEKMAS